MRHISMLAVCMAAAICGLRAQVVTFFTPDIVRIEKSPTGGSVQHAASYAVVAKPVQVQVREQHASGGTVYCSSALTVTVEHATGRVAIADSAGRLLLAETGHDLTPIVAGPDTMLLRVRQAWALAPDEAVYGIGMLQNGRLNQRGEHRLMMQSNLDDYANVFVSSRGYGIFWDCYSPTELDLRDSLVLTSQAADGVDYYFVYGRTPDGIIARLRHLTGHAPMLPRWTYGFLQSRERYRSQQELLTVVDTYRREHIPLDGIIQDWQYWGDNYHWNAMDFLAEGFADAPAMISQLHGRHHVRLTLSVWSNFGPATEPYRDMDAGGHLMHFETWPQSALPEWPPRMEHPSGVRVYAPFCDEARDIYWRHLSRLHDMGVDAWWMDSTDPDHHSYKDSDLDETVSLGHGVRRSYRYVRNAFPLRAVEGVYAHQRAATQDRRVFILTRSFFAGQQRTGASVWSGDIQSSWESMRCQVPLLLNATLTGNPQVGCDVGGFFAGAFNRGSGATGIDNPAWQELYVRWMQMGALMPLMRSHGTDIPREVYLYGAKGTPVRDALEEAIMLRYRLLPYVYGTAWQVCHADDSFMRALFMDFPADSVAATCDTEYMFGRSLLVCPVLHPASELGGSLVDGRDVVRQTVYLPAGTAWWDFHKGQRFEGGQRIEADVPLHRSPLYVRAGSIVPMASPFVDYSDGDTWSDLLIAVYPGADGVFTLYEDEGDGYAYEHGAYTEITFRWDEGSRTVTIEPRRGSYPGMLASRRFRLRTPDGRERSVVYRGRRISVHMPGTVAGSL